MRRVTLATAVWLVMGGVAVAGDDEKQKRPPAEIQVPDVASSTAPENAGLSKDHAVQDVLALYIFGTAILVLTAAVMYGGFWFMWRNNKGLDDPNSTRFLIVVFCVGVGSFLVVAGYSNNQMAGIFGLMGTIVGFIFGKVSDRKPTPPTV